MTSIPIQTPEDLYQQIIECHVGGRVGEGVSILKTLVDARIVDVISELGDTVHQLAKDKGFWDSKRSDGESIALMHSELSEALEGLRHGNPADDMVPMLTSCEVELADTIIRILDFAAYKQFNLGIAILVKHELNKTRPHKHGKTF